MAKLSLLVKLARYEEARRRRTVLLIRMGIIPGRHGLSYEDFEAKVNGPNTEHIREQIAALSEQEKELVELVRYAMEVKSREKKP